MKYSKVVSRVFLFLSLTYPTISQGQVAFGFWKPASNHGYFVETSATWDGNLGGLAGADAKCLTDLSTQNWLGKSEAATRGILIAAKVKAFLCGGGACTSPLALTTYKFALSASPTVGGAQFTTNASGSGPQDSLIWNDATHFGANRIHYSGRLPGSDNTSWPTGASAEAPETCTAWTTNVSTTDGRHGNTNSNQSARWASGTSTCNAARVLICIVNP